MRKSIGKLETVTTVGLDLAKNVFQVHAVDGQGNVVVNKAIGRAKLLAFFAALPKCLVGMEACASAHHWGREIAALGGLRGLRGAYGDMIRIPHIVRFLRARLATPFLRAGRAILQCVSYPRNSV